MSDRPAVPSVKMTQPLPWKAFLAAKRELGFAGWVGVYLADSFQLGALTSLSVAPPPRSQPSL